MLTPWDWLRLANCVWGWLRLASRYVPLREAGDDPGKPALEFRVWAEAGCVQVTPCNPASWGNQQTQVCLFWLLILTWYFLTRWLQLTVAVIQLELPSPGLEEIRENWHCGLCMEAVAWEFFLLMFKGHNCHQMNTNIHRKNVSPRHQIKDRWKSSVWSQMAALMKTEGYQFWFFSLFVWKLTE